MCDIMCDIVIVSVILVRIHSHNLILLPTLMKIVTTYAMNIMQIQYEPYGYSALTQTLISPAFFFFIFIKCMYGAQTFIPFFYTCDIISRLCVCVPTFDARQKL